jgi:LacI family kdg operon repressor
MHTDFVSLDNAAAMKAACGHLVEGGYRELLYITEPLKGVSSRKERTAAFGACIAAHEPRVSGEVFESAGDDDAEVLDAALHALHKRAKRGRRAAVLAGNAVVTLRVAASMARVGWRFGEELGFVGFDDAEWAPLIGPGLTTIAQPTEEIGRMAATCLIERLRGLDAKPRQLLLPGELIVRGSSLNA